MSAPSTVLRLGRADDARRLSSAEFAGADVEEPWTYEREGGRLLVMVPAGERHVDASETWRDWLGAYRLDHPEVVDRVVSEAWVRIDDDTDRVGDIGVYLRTD